MVGEINLKANSNREFFLIHGYTGSPTDFNSLPEKLYSAFGANVRIILLKGHGTKVEDLNGYDYGHFFEQTSYELQKSIKAGRKVVVGGLCFGGQLALLLSAVYPVSGVFHIVTPYRLTPLLQIPGLMLLGYFKKYWQKKFYDDELKRRRRRGAFYYEVMPSRGLEIVKSGIKEMKRNLKNVKCPCFGIHALGDPISLPDSAVLIEKEISSKFKRHIILGKVRRNLYHNLFYSPDHRKVYVSLINFLKQSRCFN